MYLEPPQGSKITVKEEGLERVIKIHPKTEEVMKFVIGFLLVLWVGGFWEFMKILRMLYPTKEMFSYSFRQSQGWWPDYAPGISSMSYSGHLFPKPCGWEPTQSSTTPVFLLFIWSWILKIQREFGDPCFPKEPGLSWRGKCYIHWL